MSPGASLVFFSAVALIAWVVVGLLLVEIASGRRRWVDAAKWSHWAVGGAGIVFAALSFTFPATPKLAYCAIALASIIAAVCWAFIRWTSSPLRPFRLIQEAATLLVVVVWLLYADSDWYMVVTLPFGTHHTTPYLTQMPLWWWTASLGIPAIAVAHQARSLGLSPHIIAAQWHDATQAPALTHRFIATTGTLLVALVALFLALDFIVPRVGHQIYEGDEFGYVVGAYQLLEFGEFKPPHMPLISLWIAAIFKIAGDSPTALLIGNAGLVFAGLLFWIGTLRLLTSDLRVILLGGLLIASLRTNYMFVWAPLSETLNNTLWSAAVYFLIAAVRRPTIPFQIAFGITVALLLLCRSQNLGGVIGLLLVGTVLTLLHAVNRQALAPMIIVALIGCFVVSALVPLAAWGTYRKITNGQFQIFDGRGAEVMLGMNSPGVSQGLDAGAWLPNADRWKTEHPKASTKDMLLAAVRFRIADPQETASYLWYRTLEFLNVRIAIALNSGFEGIVRPNIQLFIGLIACVLLLGNANRWIGFTIWAVFLPFMATFLLIYSEARYRAPMDQMLTFGVTVLAANFLFGARLTPPLRTATNVAAVHLPRRWIATGVAIACVLVVMGALLGQRWTPADLNPAEATVVDKLPAHQAAYRQLPTFRNLLNESDIASLQGKMFCDQFNLIGNLFKESLAYYKDNGVRGGERFSRGYPKADYNIATPVESIAGARLKAYRTAISLNGAVIERGIKQRGKVSVIGRVSQLPEYYSAFAAEDHYWFLDALTVIRADGPQEQTCPR